MTRKNVATVLIPAVLAVVLTACSSEEAPAPLIPDTTIAPTTTVSPFGIDSLSELGAKIERDNATTIVETVEQRGGTPEQAIAALMSSVAETGWQSGLQMAPPATGIRDIYGWRLKYNLPADSAEVVVAATNTFMDNAATVTVSADDPAAYSLAAQHSDPRGYNEKEHFYKKGETAATEYAAALPKAQAAYAETARFAVVRTWASLVMPVFARLLRGSVFGLDAVYTFRDGEATVRCAFPTVVPCRFELRLILQSFGAHPLLQVRDSRSGSVGPWG